MYTPVNLSFTIQKWGLRGSKLYRYVFVMCSSKEDSNQSAYPLKSACASSLHCPYEETLHIQIAPSEDSDQTSQAQADLDLCPKDCGSRCVQNLEYHCRFIGSCYMSGPQRLNYTL